MRKEINWRNLQTSGLRVTWECPRGHEEEDTTPLDKFAYCRSCGTTYFWDEVEQVGPLKQLPRVTKAEAV